MLKKNTKNQQQVHQKQSKWGKNEVVTNFRRHKTLYKKVYLITVHYLAQPQIILYTTNCSPQRRLIEIRGKRQ